MSTKIDYCESLVPVAGISYSENGIVPTLAQRPTNKRIPRAPTSLYISRLLVGGGGRQDAKKKETSSQPLASGLQEAPRVTQI